MRLRHCCAAREQGVKDVKPFILGLTGNVFLTIVVLVPAWSQQSNSHTPRPGSIHSVEGQASIGTDELANTIVKIEKGRAMVEVLDIHRKDDIRIELGGASAKLLNKALYDFDADDGAVDAARSRSMA